ncbi:MAG: phosphatidylcholine synthase [Hyphomicrobiales bacterium]|nr:phosphatidylcholine synthase [Hyphomicrobiales bacterium]
MPAAAIWAGLVHAFTASGVIPAFFALVATARHDYAAAFAWLGLAFVIDGLDGPLARYVGTKKNLPRFCGERLDLVIDYVTYVVVPAFMIYEAGLVPAGWNGIAAALALISALYHFSDTESKTEDGYFVGFPAIWNLIVFYLFATPISQPAALAVITVLAALTFIPLKWVHPVRVRELRLLTFLAMAAWTAAAVMVLAQGFPGSGAAQGVLIVTGLYSLAIGFIRSARRSAV